MAKIRHPTLFSKHFGLGGKALKDLGVFDPTLNVDTPLFLDPLLLADSAHEEMRSAATTYREHFERVMDLLAESKTVDDVAWRGARRLLAYPEIKGTCLGFGAASISGSAFGPKLTDALIVTAKQIVDIGIKNPHLFPSLILFEDNVGPDRISDLTTNVVLADLLRFNARVLRDLDVPREEFRFKGGLTARLPRNPTPELSRPTPIILVPLDVLREMPTAGDWPEILEAMQHNLHVREQFNEHLSEIWKDKVRRDKDEVRRRLFESPDAFRAFAGAIEILKARAYDTDRDPDGLVSWHKYILQAVANEPLRFETPSVMTGAEAVKVVRKLVERFKFLIEERGVWKELWSGAKARPEKSLQRLFFVMADAYCESAGLDLTPEADSGNGPVDFKVSHGAGIRILVELKLSTNTKLVGGFTKQLKTYADAENPVRSFYVVADIGAMSNKDEQLLKAQKGWKAKNGSKCEVEFIDATRKKSASKR